MESYFKMQGYMKHHKETVKHKQSLSTQRQAHKTKIILFDFGSLLYMTLDV